MAEINKGYKIYNHGGNEIEVIKGDERWKVQVKGRDGIELIRYDNDDNSVDDTQIKELNEEVKDAIKTSSTIEKLS